MVGMAYKERSVTEQADAISNPRFYQMHADSGLVPDSEPICAILAVSHIHFLRSQKLHIGKSNSLEVGLNRRWIVISQRGVLFEGPNRSVRYSSEALQQSRGRTKVENDLAPWSHR